MMHLIEYRAEVRDMQENGEWGVWHPVTRWSRDWPLTDGRAPDWPSERVMARHNGISISVRSMVCQQATKMGEPNGNSREKELKMTTNQEHIEELIRRNHARRHSFIGPAGSSRTLADAGLLMPDEDERLPSWVYDHPDVCTNPHRMGGQPCIRGTRVPVDIIFKLMDGPDGCTDEEVAYFYPHVPADKITRLRTAREEHNDV